MSYAAVQGYKKSRWYTVRLSRATDGPTVHAAERGRGHARFPSAKSLPTSNAASRYFFGVKLLELP